MPPGLGGGGRLRQITIFLSRWRSSIPNFSRVEFKSVYVGADASSSSGSGTETSWGIAVDGSGNAYVTGTTSSIDFPTTNPLQSSSGGGFDQA
jgi:hypothetical protein